MAAYGGSNGLYFGDGEQIPTATTGIYTYVGGGNFLVYSDTEGLITGKSTSGKTLVQYVGKGLVTRVALSSVDLAATRAAMATANLIACLV